jgi:hypothetical protein
VPNVIYFNKGKKDSIIDSIQKTQLFMMNHKKDFDIDSGKSSDELDREGAMFIKNNKTTLEYDNIKSKKISNNSSLSQMFGH